MTEVNPYLANYTYLNIYFDASESQYIQSMHLVPYIISTEQEHNIIIGYNIIVSNNLLEI